MGKSESERTAPSKRVNYSQAARWKRKSAKGLTKALASPDAKAQLEKHLTRDPLTTHWYLRDDAFSYPCANSGGRELVFQILMGRVANASIILQKCKDAECVNPFHCEVETREVHKQKKMGKYDPMVVDANGKCIRKSELDRSFVVYKWVRGEAAERKKMRKEREAERARLGLVDAFTDTPL